MHASRVSVHSWEGHQRIDDVVERPSVGDVEAAIRRLDGDRTSEVCIDADDGGCFILGGGAGRYVGFVSRSEEEIHNLVNLIGSSERKVKLRVGGQSGYYTERQCVDLDSALKAARTFAERGELESSVTWELNE